MSYPVLSLKETNAILVPSGDQAGKLLFAVLLVKRVTQVKHKMDLMAYDALDLSKLRDGSYDGTSLGYKGDITATVTLAGGRIVDIKLKHKEDIDRGATKVVPNLIVEKQTVKIDAVTGATTTSDAIVAATFEALKKAGLSR